MKLRRLLRSPWFWAAVLGLGTIPLLRPLLRRVPDPPPVLYQLPDYRLVDQHGHAFGSAELRGRVHAVAFFFTRCPSICPKLTRAMRTLQRRYQRYEVAVRLVSISVDPEHDTPEVLTAYAKKHRADLSSWAFLTGPAKDVQRLVTSGFKTHLGQPRTNPAGMMDIAHAGAIALVDRNGGVRGFFRTDEQGLDELFHRSIHVSLSQD